MISKTPAGKFENIKKKVKQIIKKSTRGKNLEVVHLLKDLVPEYKSENSEYEILDKPIEITPVEPQVEKSVKV